MFRPFVGDGQYQIGDVKTIDLLSDPLLTDEKYISECKWILGLLFIHIIVSFIIV